jgi:hypothetical protein
MPKYLCLQRAVPGSEAQSHKPSPEQMQALYEGFKAWQAKFQSNLTDLGGRLGAGRLALQNPSHDGPFIEVKDLVGGYMIVSAESLDQAIGIARACPGLVSATSGVEVIEIRGPE